MEDHHAQINRRSCLKAAAGIAGLTAFGVGSAAASEEDYDVIEVPAGETHRVSLSDGETFENTLIDISADGAEYRIRAMADNWEIRNIGVRGTWDTDYKSQPFVVSVQSEDATGVIENVYLGNPVNDSLGGVTGIYVMRGHAGELQLDRVNIQNFGDNGLYSSSPGHASSDANGGDTVVTNSYASNNLVTGFRIGTSGSSLTNCVAYDNEHRGVWTYYEQPELIDCDIGKNPTDIYVGISADYYEKGTRTEATVTNTRFEEVHLNTSTNDIHGESVGSPRDRIPEGCPTSAEEAANGGGSDEADSEPSGENDGELPNTIVVDGTQTDEVSVYEFTVSGDIEVAPELTSVADDGLAWDSMEAEVAGDTASGVVGNGTDGFRFSGEITDEEIRGNASVSVEMADQ